MSFNLLNSLKDNNMNNIDPKLQKYILKLEMNNKQLEVHLRKEKHKRKQLEHELETIKRKIR